MFTARGRVWLDGNLATWPDVAQAGLIAAQVPGVREVINRVAARGDVLVADDVIRERIAGAFERDVTLTRLPLEVIVVDGEVSVDGEVGNANERQRALRRARDLAPGGFVTDRIRVVPMSEPFSGSAEAPEGEDLAALVRADLALDPRLRETEIEVSAENRLVFLQGTVRHLGQQRVAEEDARNVVGVAYVTNDLTLPLSDRSGAEIRADLATALQAVPALQSVSYELNAGAVTLRGSVPDWAARALASVVIADVAGVQKIRNELLVRVATEISDGEIAERVARGLERNWTTSFASKRIGVSVGQGVVQLSGDVDTWGQWHAAQRIARRIPGARKVENELRVDPYPFSMEQPTDSKEGWLDHDSPDRMEP